MKIETIEMVPENIFATAGVSIYRLPAVFPA
jgi:hypothetical protein